MNPKNIIDEDLCAICVNCSLLQPPPRKYYWEVPAICAAGFPFNKLIYNVISQCPSFERMSTPPNTQGGTE